ncbi:MAG: hypothetical protein H0T73_14230 [Ardenticatenales bacterium]|nr:hypothetical protein [Ardenticatenales bacterium]
MHLILSLQQLILPAKRLLVAVSLTLALLFVAGAVNTNLSTAYPVSTQEPALAVKPPIKIKIPRPGPGGMTWSG